MKAIITIFNLFAAYQVQYPNSETPWIQNVEDHGDFYRITTTEPIGKKCYCGARIENHACMTRWDSQGRFYFDVEYFRDRKQETKFRVICSREEI